MDEEGSSVKIRSHRDPSPGRGQELLGLLGLSGGVSSTQYYMCSVPGVFTWTIPLQVMCMALVYFITS